MSYSINVGEDVATGLRRVASEEMGCVLQALESKRPRPEDIFDARRHLKKVRALLRFMEKPFSGKSFDQERKILRKLAKTLAPNRDSSARDEAFKQLLREMPKQKRNAFLSTKQEMGRDGKAERVDAGQLKKSMELLQEIMDRRSQWELEEPGKKQFIERIKESYRCCRKAACHQVRLKESDLFHEWRKQVKELGYHLLLVKFAWRDETASVRKCIKSLSRCLGEHHDMDLLLEWFCGMDQKDRKKREAYGIMIRAIRQRKKKLQQHAVKLGNKLFCKKPGEFVNDYLRFRLV